MDIKFQPFTDEKTPLLKPVPAISSLPNWYKKMSPYIAGDKAKFYADGTKNLTVKRCNPVGDALGAGYFLVLENDLYIEENDDGPPSLVWHAGGERFISEHGQNQVSPDLIPEGFSQQPFKFKNDWSIKTPKGYSVLITHPMNRYNEAFLTLSGIVDTDSFHLAIQLPFLIRSDFTGIIQAGTPIAQVIPFKREKWKSKFLEHSSSFVKELKANYFRVMDRPYKRFHWNRKEYK